LSLKKTAKKKVPTLNKRKRNNFQSMLNIMKKMKKKEVKKEFVKKEFIKKE